MAWTAPSTWVAGAILTAAQLNQQLRDNMLASGPFLTALPAAPADGDQIYYQASSMAAAGIVWHLRYNSASASIYKWEFVGGSALTDRANGTVTTTSVAVPVALTGGPSVTIPLAGQYIITYGASLASTADYAVIVPRLNTLAIAGIVEADYGLINGVAPLVSAETFTAPITLAATGPLALYYFIGSTGTATFLRRAVSAIPVRVI